MSVLSRILKQHLLLAPVFLLTIGSTIPVVAYPPSEEQWLSQRLTPISPSTPKPFPEIPKPTEKPQLETPPRPSPSPPREEISEKIQIAGFRFVGNTAFTEKELEKVVAGFIGKKMTFSELLEVEQIITNYYVQAGYINSGAVIEAGQTLSLEKAIVTITIVEGGLEGIQVTGTQHLNPDYISSRLAIATEKPLNQNRLLSALQLLQLDPLIESISAQLSAGVRPDLDLLTVKVTEAKTLSLSTISDNGRNSSVGSFRRGLQLRDSNLVGLGDAIEVSYANTDGSNEVDLSYTIPVNPYNGTIRVAGGYSSNEVIAKPFNSFNITGEYDYYEISFRQPILRSPTEEVALGITLSHQDSKNFLLGEGFPISEGADNNGQLRISAIRFFQDWVKRNPQEVFALNSQFSFGLGILDATINNPPIPDSRFFVWRGQGQYVRSLAPDTLLVVRSDLQLAGTHLLSLEQFSLGGLGTVLGYPQDTLLTDNAFLATAEVRLPIAHVPDVQGVLQIIPFTDFGIGWNNGIFPNPSPNTLVSVGLGLQWQMNNNFSARFDWGIPLVPVNVPKTSWNDNGLYFNINYNFF